MKFSALLLPLAALVAGATALSAADAHGKGAKAKPEKNPTLAAIAPNTWQRVADPPPAPLGILAYCGGVIDTDHNAYLVFGGGHADYWGNEVCALDLKTLTWKRMYEPDAQARYTNANLDHPKGRLKDSDKPYSRHSYQQMAYVPSVKKMFIWSGCGPGFADIAPQCFPPPDSWYYDLAANKWEEVATDAPTSYGGGTCYDSKRNVLWAVQGTSWPELWKWDVATAKWSHAPMSPRSPFYCHLNLAYAGKHDLIVAAVGEGRLSYVIDPEKLTLEAPDVSTYLPHGAGGLVYLPDQDVVLSVHDSSGVYDFKTKKWYPIKVDKYFDGERWVFGHCNYDPTNGVVILVNRSGTWAYMPPPKYDLAPAKDEKKPTRK